MRPSNGDVAAAHHKECNIHRCRFVDYQPPKITALAFSHSSKPSAPTPDSLLLAVGRSNGDIDIWSPSPNWTHKITLKGGKDQSIEGLAWVPPPLFSKSSLPRLFSISGSPYLTEWEVATGLPKQHLASNAGAIWSLAVSHDSSTIALGCGDGTVMLVDVGDGSFTYSRCLEAQSSQVVSLAWHPNGAFLVGGCADSSIRVWEPNHPYGRIITQMKVDTLSQKGQRPKKKRRLNTYVWNVKVASDGTIISGDSTGSLKIWESQFWSLTQSFQVHKSDILCLVFDNDERTIFSSGVDRKTMRYQQLTNGKWAHVGGDTYHKHDVRAMAAYESEQIRMIVSGGVDRSFSVLSFKDSGENLRVVPPIPQEQIVILAKNDRLLLSWSDSHVKLWKLEEVRTLESDGEDQIGIRFLLEMQLSEEENISAVAISPDGEYILIATLLHSKLFALSTDETTSKVSVEPLGEFPYGARLAAFTQSGTTIVLVTPDSEVQIHPFLDDEVPVTHFGHSDAGTFINKLAISPDGSKFATSSSNSTVIVQQCNPEFPAQMLPQPSSAITSLTFLTPDLLSITLADRNRLLLFECRNGEWSLHPFSQDAANTPQQISITVDNCRGTFITNNDTSRIWLWGANWLAWIKPDGPKSPKHLVASSERKSKHKSDTVDIDEEYSHWITYRYREVLLVDCMSSGPDKMELVVVERPRHEILEDVMEPQFYVHQYGT